MTRRPILVVHSTERLPGRKTVLDYLRSFERYGPHEVFYVNVHGLGRVPDYLARFPFALILFDVSFASGRWNHAIFPKMVEAVRPLAGHPAPKALFAQDEHMGGAILSRFVEEFRIAHVFTVAPLSEVPKIYDPARTRGVRFERVLTGYLDPQTLRKIEHLQAEAPARAIDIGYRAYAGQAWLGRASLLKADIGPAVDAAAKRRGLRTDISTRPEDTIYGMDWYRFLLSSRCTIGAESGATVLDPDATLAERCGAYLAEHPRATYEEIAAACFPGRDDEVRYLMLGPRHLEAAATKTCQILVEGEYNGVLSPWKHYIPLEADFSNVADCMEAAADAALRERLVEAAYKDLVESGNFTYAKLVDDVFAATVAR
ncbi:MAG: hypothetical protein ACT4PT_11835, partial [Methanobacteriota archaeon]